MRRTDREVTDLKEIQRIIAECDVCRLGLKDLDGYPYILPLNFGYKFEEERTTFYFHSAMEGKKQELLAADCHVAFEMDCRHLLHSDRRIGRCTMHYQSVMGRGHVSFITDEAEKLHALTLLTDRYHPEDHFDFNTAAIPRTSVYKLEVENLTAKNYAPKK
ncbi:MAG: pyridoxamine 5'-phosphate oxidase family protein [Bacteroidales bacterium]|nr:pyridoxamine 5'-phosphate oxidase family protein [Bacteroidales bacterium]